MADKPVLLTDAQMQQFIRDGYLILHPDSPEGFHEKVYKRIDESFEKNSGRNPGNNLLPAVPELQDVWDSPHCTRRILQHPRTRLLSAPCTATYTKAVPAAMHAPCTKTACTTADFVPTKTAATTSVAG